MLNILIAFDGSGDARNAIVGLQAAGLPTKANVVILSVSEIYLPLNHALKPPKPVSTESDHFLEQWNKQACRNLAHIENVVSEAKGLVTEQFPEWKIQTEVHSGSAARTILQVADRIVADLIVVGAQGLSWDRTPGLGSISQIVAWEASWDGKNRTTTR